MGVSRPERLDRADPIGVLVEHACHPRERGCALGLSSAGCRGFVHGIAPGGGNAAVARIKLEQFRVRPAATSILISL